MIIVRRSHKKKYQQQSVKSETLCEDLGITGMLVQELDHILLASVKSFLYVVVKWY